MPHQDRKDAFRRPSLSQQAAVSAGLPVPKPGDPAKKQDRKPPWRCPKADGPMAFLACQIVKRMGKAGWPSRVYTVYRTPEQQQREFDDGDSKARPFQSPHQYYEAADIVHKTQYWNAPAAYWEALAQCVRVVEAEYKVKLVHGHHWRFVDSAHVELIDWRLTPAAREKRVPTSAELWERFREVLPAVTLTPDDKRAIARALGA